MFFVDVCVCDVWIVLLVVCDKPLYLPSNYLCRIDKLFFPPLPINVHLMSVLNPSLSSMTSADMVDDRMGEISIHDDVGGRLTVGGEDVVNREIGENTN